MPLAFLLMGLRDGALGRDGRDGLDWGGPGLCSSIMWAHKFNNLQTFNKNYISGIETKLKNKLHATDVLTRVSG